MTSARGVALEVSEAIRRDGAFANLVLPPALTRARLSSRDAGHATDLVYGSARWQALLDAIIDRCVTGSLSRVDADVLDLLRLATYELTVRSEPPHVINEWVNQANRRFRRAAGFVNATLRTVSRRTGDEWRELLSSNLGHRDALALRYSHPRWIVDEFVEILGVTEAEALLSADNQPTTPTLVALPGLATRTPDLTPTELSPFGFVSPGGNVTSIDGVREGVVRVQDEGSQLAAITMVAAMPLTAGEKWLDLCAGPGGKTALLAAIALPESISVVANEVQRHRADLVRGSLAPFDNKVFVEERDGRVVCAENPATFDRILVDAPCTGLGALRRRPESRWRKNPRDLDELVPLQGELLNGALDAVRVGGVVAYVTCSPHRAETVELIDTVTFARTDCELLDTTAVLESAAPQLRDATRGTAVQLWPHRHHTDAMFIQLIRRTR